MTFHFFKLFNSGKREPDRYAAGPASLRHRTRQHTYSLFFVISHGIRDITGFDTGYTSACNQQMLVGNIIINCTLPVTDIIYVNDVGQCLTLLKFKDKIL